VLACKGGYVSALSTYTLRILVWTAARLLSMPSFLVRLQVQKVIQLKRGQINHLRRKEGRGNIALETLKEISMPSRLKEQRKYVGMLANDKSRRCLMGVLRGLRTGAEGK
jgi:hypothetical protein